MRFLLLEAQLPGPLDGVLSRAVKSATQDSAVETHPTVSAAV